MGYITNKNEFKKLIDEEILNPDELNVAYVDIESMPEYKFLLINKNEQTSESEIFSKIQEKAVTTYRLYAVTLNDENVAYSNSLEEAENAVSRIKEENKKSIENIDIAVKEFYTTDITSTESLQIASNSNNTQSNIQERIEEQIKIKASTFEGVYFSVKPVTGVITSRFGAVESIRDHTHKGIDIGAPNGTKIKAAADGTVSFSGWYGGYGNLVIITHANGIQTYYGHCSKLYASVGDTVKAGDVIALVGSTGQSTGNHLHFEIRKNGSQINPQKYLYK